MLVYARNAHMGLTFHNDSGENACMCTIERTLSLWMNLRQMNLHSLYKQPNMPRNILEPLLIKVYRSFMEISTALQ